MKAKRRDGAKKDIALGTGLNRSECGVKWSWKRKPRCHREDWMTDDEWRRRQRGGVVRTATGLGPKPVHFVMEIGMEVYGCALGIDPDLEYVDPTGKYVYRRDDDRLLGIWLEPTT